MRINVSGCEYARIRLLRNQCLDERGRLDMECYTSCLKKILGRLILNPLELEFSVRPAEECGRKTGERFGEGVHMKMPP